MAFQSWCAHPAAVPVLPSNWGNLTPAVSHALVQRCVQNQVPVWQFCHWSHGSGGVQAAYAPLYKADARAEARTIESPFSQTLTTNNQENKSRTAAEKPVNMCTSISLEVRSLCTCTNLSATSSLVRRTGQACVPTLVGGLMLLLCMRWRITTTVVTRVATGCLGSQGRNVRA